MGVIVFILVVAVAYVAYVFLSYSRIEDNIPLEVEGRATADEAKIGEEYTAVSYNIGFGAYTPDFTFFMDGGESSWAASKESVISCVEGAGDTALSFSPDVVLYQEVDIGSTRSYQVEERAILEDMFDGFSSVFGQNYHSAFLMYPLTQPHGASNSGVLTFSDVGITSAVRRSLPIAASVKKILDLDRCYTVARVNTEDGKELVIYNTHLSAYGTDASQGNAQLEMLFEDMKAEYDAGNYVICGGDFNHDFTGDSRITFNPGTEDIFTWCQPFPVDIIPEGFSRCLDFEDASVPSTRNTDIPYSDESFTVTLDGFIISDNVECTYIQVVDTGFQYSDHNPVVLKFRLKG